MIKSARSKEGEISALYCVFMSWLCQTSIRPRIQGSSAEEVLGGGGVAGQTSLRGRKEEPQSIFQRHITRHRYYFLIGPMFYASIALQLAYPYEAIIVSNSCPSLLVSWVASQTWSWCAIHLACPFHSVLKQEIVALPSADDLEIVVRTKLSGSSSTISSITCLGVTQCLVW